MAITWPDDTNLDEQLQGQEARQKINKPSFCLVNEEGAQHFLRN
jgi:hypothetical protein